MTHAFQRGTRTWLMTLIVCSVLLVSAARSAPARAESGVPWWHITATTAPTNLHPGGEGLIQLIVTNAGDGQVNATSGNPVTVTDVLPPGLEATSIKAAAGVQLKNGAASPAAQVECTAPAGTITCTYPGPESLLESRPLIPFESLEVNIYVKVASDIAPGAEGSVAVAGAGVSPVTVPQRPTIGGADEYGVRDFELSAENEGGSTDTQAGSHPFQLTTSIDLNEAFVPDPYTELQDLGIPLVPKSVALTKDLLVRLPPGLVGNATTLPQCSEAEFTHKIGVEENSCTGDAAVGVAAATILEPVLLDELAPTVAYPIRHWDGVGTISVPVFNLRPGPGEPARFGFDAFGTFVTLDTSVATGEDYAVVTAAENTTEIASLLSSRVTLWGRPGDPLHSRSRGWLCLKDERSPESCGALSEPGAKPFLRLPTSCQAPLKSTLFADSWPEPGGRLADGAIDTNDPRWKRSNTESGALQGCESLPFTPSLKVEPETEAGSSPSGMKFDVHLPQVENETAEGPSESDVKSTTVTLPQGVLLSPAAAHGLQSCSESQVGYQGKSELESEPGDSLALFTSNLPEAFCSEASKVGNVRIKTPLLEHELEGGVYLASQNANPFNSLIALYVVAKDPVSGVLVKITGKATLDESTGQISTTFENTPQTPFEDFKLEFFGGSTASLTTPPTCGTHTATASFVPWSGGKTVNAEASFQTTSNCTNPGSAQPFSPSFQAGPTNPQAGAYSPFTLTLGNPDGDQALKSLTMHLAPGMAAMLSSVTPCPESQVANNECGEESLIGHSTAVSGLGGDPYSLPGKVYLTGPYKGAPFGLSVVTPAIAGPFNLGDITVRSTINVDRNDASVTITSDPFPEFVQGIPSQLKQVNVYVDRTNFEFNPTNCAPMTITGTLTGVGGASQAVSAPTQVGNCAALPFKPTLTASTKGNASKAYGAALTVKVTSSPGQANIAKTKLVLPITLPSRLTTIQKACLDSVFEVNPAGCAEGSNIGSATVYTPVLKNPLHGPAYLVSHGNAAFPDVEFVLQGEGITLILDGQTDIKKGITTTTFNSVPDAPVTTFETVLPEGPHSALTSNVAESKHFSLCGAKLVIPTTITGQNGAVIQQETKVPVLGCAAVKAFKETKTQKLSKALKACRKKFKHKKAKRLSCEKQARKKYATHAKSKTKHKSAKKKK
jgi:hypothetical protein